VWLYYQVLDALDVCLFGSGWVMVLSKMNESGKLNNGIERTDGRRRINGRKDSVRSRIRVEERVSLMKKVLCDCLNVVTHLNNMARWEPSPIYQNLFLFCLSCNS
jgi:hypothetical protein